MTDEWVPFTANELIQAGYGLEMDVNKTQVRSRLRASGLSSCARSQAYSLAGVEHSNPQREQVYVGEHTPLRRDHGVRIPKTELWRALLHLASGMMADPERVDELLAACSVIAEEE